jgi:hypothetical protein
MGNVYLLKGWKPVTLTEVNVWCDVAGSVKKFVTRRVEMCILKLNYSRNESQYSIFDLRALQFYVMLEQWTCRSFAEEEKILKG